MKIYISKLQNPYLNLAIEDYLFKQNAQYTLFFYRNVPSVVIGRNQNPWKEINLSQCRKDNILIVRRNSGGGTVYHDLGNTNYCFMLPKQEFDRTFALEKIRLALHQLDIPAMFNSRHDLCVEEKKISGSAFKLTSSRAYHHGTMLIDTDLNLLLKYLTPKSIDIQGLGTDSVRSTVTKLRDYSYTIDHSSFCESVGLEFQKQFGKTETVFVDSSFVNDTIRDIAASLQTREWIYGQTPRYSLKLSKDFGFGLIDIELVVEKGIVTKATVSSPNQPFSKRLEKALENQKMYGILVKDKFSDLGFIFDWLSQEVST